MEKSWNGSNFTDDYQILNPWDKESIFLFAIPQLYFSVLSLHSQEVSMCVVVLGSSRFMASQL